MDLGLAGAAVLVGIAAGIAPGPLLTVAISETLRHGLRAGILIALAPILTDAPALLATIALVHFGTGLDPFVAAVSILGATFLLYLAHEGWNAPAPHETTSAETPRPLRRGMITNILNPNLYIFWATVGAAFLVDTMATGTAAVLTFLVAFYAAMFLAKVAVALVAARARDLLKGRAFVWTNRTLALLLIVVAARFLLEGIAAFRRVLHTS